MSVLRNVKVEWASIQECDRKFEPVYRVDCIISEEQKKELEEEVSKLGCPKPFKFRTNDKGDIIIRIKRKELKADGTFNKKPVCKGTKKDELTGKLEDFTELVGNGSVCNVQYNFYTWENSFGKGVNCDLNGIQVIEHVSYGAGDGDEFDEVESSVSSSKPTQDSYDDEDFS